VLARRVEVSQLLIEHSVDLDIWDIEDGTLLHMAVYRELLEVVQTLLEHDGAFKTRANIRDKKG
jgi:ankyrin repeat protein